MSTTLLYAIVLAERASALARRYEGTIFAIVLAAILIVGILVFNAQHPA